jgi:MinD-like ATPase involved in chromosome partitioning or flagellar assembly
MDMNAVNMGLSRVVVLGEPSEEFESLLTGSSDLQVRFLRHEALSEAFDFGPDVVICVCNERMVETGFDASRITQLLRRPLILYGEGQHAPTFDQALAWGAKDFFSARDSFERIHMSIRSNALLGRDSAAVASGGAGRARARRIAVHGAKGGVGATTLSTTLAAVYARQGLDTLLIDLDLQFGDVAISFDLSPRETLVDYLMTSGGALDLDKVRGCVLAPRARTNLSILPAPLNPADAELVTEARLRSIVEAVQYAYDIIVFDLPSQITETALVALDCADEVVCVASPQAAAVKDMMLGFNTLQQLGLQGRISRVLNRASRAEARNFVGRRREFGFDHWLPADKAVTAAAARGLLVEGNRSSQFGHAATNLARALVEGTGYEVKSLRPTSRYRLKGLLRRDKGTEWSHEPLDVAAAVAEHTAPETAPAIAAAPVAVEPVVAEPLVQPVLVEPVSAHFTAEPAAVHTEMHSNFESQVQVEQQDEAPAVHAGVHLQAAADLVHAMTVEPAMPDLGEVGYFDVHDALALVQEPIADEPVADEPDEAEAAGEHERVQDEAAEPAAEDEEAVVEHEAEQTREDEAEQAEEPADEATANVHEQPDVAEEASPVGAEAEVEEPQEPSEPQVSAAAKALARSRATRSAPTSALDRARSRGRVA